MLSSRLAPYILVSFLIHAAALIGAHQFLKLPAEELETEELIPVEVVVVREEAPASRPEIISGERTWPQPSLQTIGPKILETATDRSVDHTAAPIPMAVSSEPAVMIIELPSTGILTKALRGESAVNKPMLPISQILPSPILPVAPPAPTETSPLEVIMPTILAKAKAEMTVAEIPAPQRASIPLPTSRSSAAPVSEPPFARERPIEPHLNLFTKPTLREVPRVSQLEPVAGKPMMPASQASPLQFSLVEPSAPPTSSHLDAELLAVPVEVKTALSPLDSLSSQKIATLLGGRRRREDFIVENQPIPAEGAQVPVSMGSTLQVQSQPNGAQVYVNGKSIGKTPLTWELPLGKHEVRLALPDYYGWESQIELTESNQAHPIFIRLLSAK